jgi:hypothetical protein
MKRSSTLFLVTIFLISAAAVGQSGPASDAAAVAANQGPSAQGEPVSYASVTQLNGMLGQLESSSKSTQDDLTKLRIERWKTDNSYKKQTLSNIDAIQRNLQSALPEMIAKMRAAPEDLPATFKLYRNLDALYDVLGSVVESVGAFGGKDEFQSLSNDLNTFEATRKQMAERIETLSSAKEAEIVRLRADLKTAKAAVPATPPPRIVVDDTAPPPKKPAPKKKPATKPANPSTTNPSAQGQTQAPKPPAQQPPAQPPQ